MFKKNKNKDKEEKNTVVSKIGDTSRIVANQNSSERRQSESITEHRSITSYTSTSSYSSVRVTKTELGKSIITSGTPALNKSVSLFDQTPFQSNLSTNGTGYQSVFSRKLTPFALDAKPFNTNLQASSSPQRKVSNQTIPLPQNLPRYSSYHPEPAQSSTLISASSTQSLPTTSEPKTQDPRIPTYNTIGKKRGKVLVINNIKFVTEKNERKGAEKDEKSIRTLFKDMGFDVDLHRDLKKNAMVDKIDAFRKNSSLKNADISVLILMSHGSNVDDNGKIVQGGFTQIYGVDNVGLQIDDILDKFSTEKCPSMAGKPKIFIFQCCRGQDEERNTLHNDGISIKRAVKKHGDMLIAFSTLPGFFSIRDTQQGSWYIQGICDVFRKHAKEFDVETLLKIVDDQLSQKHPQYQQTSTYENRGFKRCFLNPK